MRWERLFADLEAQADDLELDERDALIEEMRDGEWAVTSWRSLLGGEVVLEVRGVGQVEGTARLVNDQIVQLEGQRVDHIVNVHAVVAVVSAERRADDPSRVAAAWGWRQVLRALRQSGDLIRVARVDGTPVDGLIDVVGQDFVRLRSDAGREAMVPFCAIAAISGRM